MAIEQFIIAVLPQHSRSMQDKYFEAEERELEKYTITTAKELQSIKSAAKASVEAVFKQTEFIGMVRIK
jgi:DNA-directed RNA polymerase III subunit RPC3